MTRLRDRLKLEEGLRLHAYPDPLSKGEPYTIGYGHTGREVKPDTVWTLEQAETALDADIMRARDNVFRALPWVSALDEPRLGVLIDMTFNMGVNGLLTFKNTLELIHNGQFQSAAQNMLKSRWAEQTGGRARRLARIMSSGVDE